MILREGSTSYAKGKEVTTLPALRGMENLLTRHDSVRALLSELFPRSKPLVPPDNRAKEKKKFLLYNVVRSRREWWNSDIRRDLDGVGWLAKCPKSSGGPSHLVSSTCTSIVYERTIFLLSGRLSSLLRSWSHQKMIGVIRNRVKPHIFLWPLTTSFRDLLAISSWWTHGKGSAASKLTGQRRELDTCWKLCCPLW